jgi:hypothetical protein
MSIMLTGVPQTRAAVRFSDLATREIQFGGDGEKKPQSPQSPHSPQLRAGISPPPVALSMPVGLDRPMIITR